MAAKTTVQITTNSRRVTVLIWALALLSAANLTRAAVLHHMSLLNTVTVFLFALYGSRGAVQHFVNVVRNRRR